MKKLKYLLAFVFFIPSLNVYANNAATQEKTTELTSVEPTTETTSNATPVLSEKQIKINSMLEKAAVFVPNILKVEIKENTSKEEDVNINSVEFNFENGDKYNLNRYSFEKDDTTNLEKNIKLKGSSITIRYIDPETKKWVNTSVLNNIKSSTLFIDTDTNSYVISVPGVYKNDFTNSTLTIERELEILPIITKKDGYFEIKLQFPKKTDLIGEYWLVESNQRLVDWSLKKSFDDLISHDLSKERRWSLNGYYFPTPHNYVPSGKDILYKHPSNYTGASFARYNSSNLAKVLGYVMTKTCMKNQNEYGFWETGPKSLWLETDFKIGSGFFDTRFNTDFAINLLYAYKNYGNKEFLETAIKYTEFFLEFANKNNYSTENGGILVEDYWHKDSHEKTHVSLNHQLAELNFLYEIYNVTSNKEYLDLANKMLLGIEDTQNKWVLPDGNLNYALHYNKTTNKMVDYPYLTYNDLFETKALLNKLFYKSNNTIEFLMASKKQWMDENKITGYLK